jgi:hypothetical protein
MIHHADQKTIQAMYEEYSPVFILSTGRSGSKFVAELLGLSPEARAFHEPLPTLQYFSDFAYRHRHQAETLAPVIDAARMEMVLDAYIRNRVFIESNQCLTFFAPALAAVFKNARFVHLVRHPGDFVASAARKGWYVNDSIWETGRPRPLEKEEWRQWSLVQKLGWLWNASNGFLRDFFSGWGSDRVQTCRLEDLVASAASAAGLFTFCGLRIPEEGRITALQSTKVNPLWIGAQEPPNMRKDPAFPAYDDWPEEMKRGLWDRIEGTAGGLGYHRLETRRTT